MWIWHKLLLLDHLRLHFLLETLHFEILVGWLSRGIADRYKTTSNTTWYCDFVDVNLNERHFIWLIWSEEIFMSVLTLAGMCTLLLMDIRQLVSYILRNFWLTSLKWSMDQRFVYWLLDCIAFLAAREIQINLSERCRRLSQVVLHGGIRALRESHFDLINRSQIYYKERRFFERMIRHTAALS